MSFYKASGKNEAELKANIRALVAAEYADDGVSPDEVVLEDNGAVVIDRRRKFSWAKPFPAGKWR